MAACDARSRARDAASTSGLQWARRQRAGVLGWLQGQGEAQAAAAAGGSGAGGGDGGGSAAVGRCIGRRGSSNRGGLPGVVVAST